LDKAVVRELIDAGIHFGHRVGRWNPKMKPYIFCTRNSIHIIDIKESIKGLMRAQKFLASVVASGKDILFVGTKRQARQPVLDQSARCGMPYVSERWLGGTLTNFTTIRKRLGRLEELESMNDKGMMAAQSKKMESTLRREMRKIQRNLNGIRNMDKMPGALVIIDSRREHLAIAEARILKIPTICLLDTDSDPDTVDIPIPGNDDAMRTIEIVLSELADAVLKGKSAHLERSKAAEEQTERPKSRRVSISQAAETLTQPVSAPAVSSPENNDNIPTVTDPAPPASAQEKQEPSQ